MCQLLGQAAEVREFVEIGLLLQMAVLLLLNNHRAFCNFAAIKDGDEKETQADERKQQAEPQLSNLKFEIADLLFGGEGYIHGLAAHAGFFAKVPKPGSRLQSGLMIARQQ